MLHPGGAEGVLGRHNRRVGCHAGDADGVFRRDNLRRALDEYLSHYHTERNHQGLGNELVDDEGEPGVGEVVSREGLGGLLRYYHRAA